MNREHAELETGPGSSKSMVLLVLWVANIALFFYYFLKFDWIGLRFWFGL